MLVRYREDVDLFLSVADQILHHPGHGLHGVRGPENDSAIDHQLEIVLARPFHADEDAIAQSLAIYAHGDAAVFRIVSGGGRMSFGRGVRATAAPGPAWTSPRSCAFSAPSSEPVSTPPS